MAIVVGITNASAINAVNWKYFTIFFAELLKLNFANLWFFSVEILVYRKLETLLSGKIIPACVIQTILFVYK